MFRKYLISATLALATAVFGALGAGPHAPAVAAAAGAGTIEAQGTGMAELRGAMDASVSAHYPVMLVKDFEGDGAVTGTGSAGVGPFLGYTVYYSAQNVHLSGSDIGIVVVGERIDVSASGTGWAYFKGTGTYAANGTADLKWNADDGSAVAIAAPPAAGAGQFVAHGLGVAAVRGTVELRGASALGVLLVKDIGGNATINVSGGERAEFLGFSAYAGFHSAAIKGTDVAVIVVGADVNVTATGTGWGYVQGFGAYSSNSEASEPWTITGRFADIAP